MDILSLIFIAIMAFIVLVSIIMGMVRGTLRSFSRLILVAGCAVVALLIFRKISNILLPKLLNINIAGSSIEQMLTEMFTDMNFVKEKIDQLINILFGVVVYLAIFGLLQFLSWLIIFPIIKIFIKKSKKAKVATTFFGGAIGVVQAIVIIFVFVMPIMGLSGSVINVLAIEMPEAAGSSDSSASASTSYDYDDNNGDIILKSIGLKSASTTIGGKMPLVDKIDYVAYKESMLFRIVEKINGKYYTHVSSVVEGEEVLTLNGQIETIDSLVKIANNVTKTINNIKDTLNTVEGEVSEGLNKGTVDEVKGLFNSLKLIQGEMSEEARASANKLAKDAAASLGESYNINLDLSNVDIMDADFDKESKIIEDVQKYQDMGEVDVKEMVKDLSESTFILPVLENTEITVPTSAEQKVEVEAEIANLENEGMDAATISKLKKLFGLEVA